MKKLRAIDFFCGAGGMTFGLRKAGIRVLGGIDRDTTVEKSYSENNRGARFVGADVREVTAKTLQQQFGVEPNEDDLIFVGCSPCQYWSKIKTDKSKSLESAFLLEEFLRLCRAMSPGYIVIENVPGLLTKKDSVLPKFTRALKRMGYSCSWEVRCATDFGVPQTRRRFLLMATRLSSQVVLPPRSSGGKITVKEYIGIHNGFPKVRPGHIDSSEFAHTVAALTEINFLRVKATPKDGGSRKSWSNSKALRLPAYVRNPSYFADAYSRIYWDRPAPTITTRFTSISNGRFIHPNENRGLSLREGATLQTFPKNYVFYGPNRECVARQIGNAVPPLMAKAIGSQLNRHYSILKKRMAVTRKGK